MIRVSAERIIPGQYLYVEIRNVVYALHATLFNSMLMFFTPCLWERVGVQLVLRLASLRLLPSMLKLLALAYENGSASTRFVILEIQNRIQQIIVVYV